MNLVESNQHTNNCQLLLRLNGPAPRITSRLNIRMKLNTKWNTSKSYTMSSLSLHFDRNGANDDFYESFSFSCTKRKRPTQIMSSFWADTQRHFTLATVSTIIQSKVCFLEIGLGAIKWDFHPTYLTNFT